MEVYDRRNEHFGLNRAPSSEAREFDIWGEGLLKAAKESTAMKAAFLASQGTTVEERVQQVRK